MNGLRLAAIRVSAELMHGVFCPQRPGEWVRCDSGIPCDAEYVRSYYDDRENCFVFVYQHESFPLVRPGEHIAFAPRPMLSAIHLESPITPFQADLLNRVIAEQKQRLPETKALNPEAHEMDFISGGDAPAIVQG